MRGVEQPIQSLPMPEDPHAERAAKGRRDPDQRVDRHTIGSTGLDPDDH